LIPGTKIKRKAEISKCCDENVCSKLFISESYSLDFFSAEDLFLGNLGIKEFFLGGIFISTDLGDYRILATGVAGLGGLRFLNS